MRNNPFFARQRQSSIEQHRSRHVDALRKDGRQRGGSRINAVAHNVPVGLGEPLYDRLDADIAKAMMEHQRRQGRRDRFAGFDSR